MAATAKGPRRREHTSLAHRLRLHLGTVFCLVYTAAAVLLPCTTVAQLSLVWTSASCAYVSGSMVMGSLYHQDVLIIGTLLPSLHLLYPLLFFVLSSLSFHLILCCTLSCQDNAQRRRASRASSTDAAREAERQSHAQRGHHRRQRESPATRL